MIADDDRAERPHRGFRRRIADDDKLLPLTAFGLDPIASATTAVWRIDTLRNDAFEAEAADMAQHGRTSLDEVLAVADRAVRPFEQMFQLLLAGEQRIAAQIDPVEMHQVEAEEDEVCGLAIRERGLERREGRDAAVVESDHLTVDQGCLTRQGCKHIADGVAEPIGPVEA
jgi:hypothetical protein